jgi:hypothetical protein
MILGVTKEERRLEPLDLQRAEEVETGTRSWTY